MNIFFTSDHHFYHNNIIEYCNRPFSSVTEMNAEMISRWNNTVKQSDIVYHLGDFSLGSKEHVKEILDSLNGRIFFIQGNHDGSWLTNPTIMSKTRVFLGDIKTISISNQKIVLCHYAMRSWDRSHYGVWHLYGHHHGNLAPHGLSFDVGVDTNNFYPYSFDEVKERIGNLSIAD